ATISRGKCLRRRDQTTAPFIKKRRHCRKPLSNGLDIDHDHHIWYERTVVNSIFTLSEVDSIISGRALSYRDVEELLAERGLDLSYESVRSWVLKFGPTIARRLRRCRPRPSDRWHLDEMVVRIAGQHMYLWRAVDHEGEVLEILVQRRRDRSA